MKTRWFRTANPAPSKPTPAPPPPKKVKLSAYVAVDVPAFDTVTVEVSEDLLKPENRAQLEAEMLVQLGKVYTELDSFEPDWDTQNNFRLVNLRPDESAYQRPVIMEDFPLGKNYHDFGLEVSGMFRANGGFGVPQWVEDLGRKYRLID